MRRSAYPALKCASLKSAAKVLCLIVLHLGNCEVGELRLEVTATLLIAAKGEGASGGFTT